MLLPFFLCYKCDLSVYSGSHSYGVPADHCVHSDYCSPCSVCGNVPEKGNAFSLSGSGSLSSSDHYKLRCSGCGPYQCTEGLQYPSGHCKRFLPYLSGLYSYRIMSMAGIREKIEYNDIPESFRGFPIVLITAGLMAIAFFGFSGLI